MGGEAGLGLPGVAIARGAAQQLADAGATGVNGLVRRAMTAAAHVIGQPFCVLAYKQAPGLVVVVQHRSLLPSGVATGAMIRRGD